MAGSKVDELQLEIDDLRAVVAELQKENDALKMSKLGVDAGKYLVKLHDEKFFREFVSAPSEIPPAFLLEPDYARDPAETGV